MCQFVEQVAQSGCETFIVHARKAWLKGLSPKENREIPPLRYDVVHRLKRDFPALGIVINGGVKTLQAAADQLEHLDGVMIGREAYTNPWLLADADQRVFGAPAGRAVSRPDIVEKMLPYIESALTQGVPLKRVTRHMLGLFQGQPRARSWRRHLSEHAHKGQAGVEVVEQALRLVH